MVEIQKKHDHVEEVGKWFVLLQGVHPFVGLSMICWSVLFYVISSCNRVLPLMARMICS